MQVKVAQSLAKFPLILALFVVAGTLGQAISQDKPKDSPPAKTEKLTDDRAARAILESQHKMDQTDINASSMQRQIDQIAAQMKTSKEEAQKARDAAIDAAYKAMKLDKSRWDFSVDTMEFTEKARTATKDEKGEVKGEVKEKSDAPANPATPGPSK